MTANSSKDILRVRICFQMAMSFFILFLFNPTFVTVIALLFNGIV